METCRSSYTEYNKIEFAIFGFLYDFILNLQVAANSHKKGRIYMHSGPSNFQAFTTIPLTLTVRPPSTEMLHTHGPDGGGEVAAGDVGPAQANKWHGVEIGLTLSRLVAVDQPEMSPASGGGGAMAARPRKLGSR
jgi:hypothetical protein